MSVRWVPTELMLADALTKDQADPADLLRAALFQGRYQLSAEASVLARKKQLREMRQRFWQACRVSESGHPAVRTDEHCVPAL